METVAWILFLSPAAFGVYAYFLYPAILKAFASLNPPPVQPPSGEWPMVSISLPVYNEEAQIRGVIESLLNIDYPADRRQIMVISDASSDGTDAIVREYADRGVELLRQPKRLGKTAGENAAAPLLRGDIIVNTDASIRIRPDALKPLIARFADPRTGVASGRDLSVSAESSDGNKAEGGYVGYEMWVRSLETQAGGIIGASGCFYAIRSHLHRVPMPDALSRDFGAALIAEEHGYRAVSVDESICLVPRTGSLPHEYRRKVRTITRGFETLLFKRKLLNPFRHGSFAWKLWSHKICRWAVPWSTPFSVIGLAMLASHHEWARWLLGAGAVGGVLVIIASKTTALPRINRIAMAAIFALAGNFAALHALVRAIHGDRNPTWEPTRRGVVAGG
jgi:cellulose synthase/poly-beta-1,6-N-acetylglucosamine synthase-like glycosyltransferase